MESHKEIRERLDQTQTKRDEEKKKKKDDKEEEGVESKMKKAMDDEPVAKALIRESIISDDGEIHPHDVLAFSRSVHKIDSSLE